MLSAIIVIYILLKIRSRQMIRKIKNPVKTTGKITGFEIKQGKKKKWIHDVVSFDVDNTTFSTTNTSSPFYMTGKSPIGDIYDVIYNSKNPDDSIVIDNTIFDALTKAFLLLSLNYQIR